jgi:AraC-like DNA-binding protein
MSGPTRFPLPLRALADHGFPIERLCARAGVTPADTLDTDDFFRLWLAAQEEFDDPAIGLRFGAEAADQGYGVAASVALHAPDLRGSLAALSRYKRLTCPEQIDVEIASEEAIVCYRWLEASGPVPRLLVDTTMSSLLALVRRGTAARVAPIRLALARREMDREVLRRHFGCPIAFEAPEDAMVFARSALDVPFVTADGGAFAVLLEDLEARLATIEGAPFLLGDVRIAIARHLSEGRAASIAAVAHRIGMSGRTLQRRLETCGTSFQHQLAEVRRTTASRLLAHTRLDPVAIAMLLGYAEPNSFARAFRAWEQVTPIRWREQRLQTLG